MRPTALATACFVVIALVLGWPALSGRATLGPEHQLDFDPLYRSGFKLEERPPLLDPVAAVLDWPRDLAFARGLHQGRLDLWNPLAACGTPLWAEMMGPFFPLRFPFYVSPSRVGYNTFLLLRLPLAALGAYLLGRERGLTVVGATAAGVTFELCNVLMHDIAVGVYSNRFLLPWVVLASALVARCRDGAATAAAAVILGTAVSAGHPSLGILAILAFLAATAAHVALAWGRWRTMAQLCGWAAVAVTLALALATPTILPLAQLLGVGATYKTTALNASLWQQGISSMRLLLPFGLFVPGIVGSVLGLFGLVAAMAGVVRGGLDAPLIAVGLVGLAVSVSPIGLGWVHSLPAVRFIQPVYAVPLVVLPFTQAAGRGIEVLACVRRRQIALASGVSVVGFGLMWVLCPPDMSSALQFVRSLGVATVVAHLMVPVVAAAGVLSLASMLPRTPWAPRLGLAMTALIVCEQVAETAPRFRQPVSGVIGDSSPSSAVRFLQTRLAAGDSRMIGVPLVGSPLAPMLFGLPDLRNFSALPVRRYVEYLQAIRRDTDDSTQTAEGQIPSIFRRAPLITVEDVRAVVRSPLIDVASVRYVVVTRGSGQPPAPNLENDPGMTLAYADAQVLIYENAAALSRVRLVHNFIPLPDEDAARSWVRKVGASSGHASEMGLQDTVALEPDEHGGYPPPLAPAASAGEYATITDGSDPDRLVIGAHLGGPGLVMIADTYYPGWSAWVDGVPAPVNPADLLFRAVFVPAGTHVIELRYRSLPFIVGVVLFLASSATCALLVLRSGITRHA
jgi:hypothetical protein